MGQGPCGEQSVGRPTRFARLPYVLGPFVTPLAEQRKRVRRRGLALRVTRRHCRGHDASPNPSSCHAHVVYLIGQERRATATGTFSAKAPARSNRLCPTLALSCPPWQMVTERLQYVTDRLQFATQLLLR
jgi:hypothetical protein